MKILIVCDTDLDGMGGAAILLHHWSAFPDIEVDVLPKAHGPAFSEWSPQEDVDGYVAVYVVDHSVDLLLYSKFSSLLGIPSSTLKQVIIVDHHPQTITCESDLQYTPGLRHPSITIHCNASLSAAELVQVYASEVISISDQKARITDDVAKLIGDHDLWRYKDLDPALAKRTQQYVTYAYHLIRTSEGQQGARAQD